jgi:predicted ATPase
MDSVVGYATDEGGAHVPDIRQGEAMEDNSSLNETPLVERFSIFGLHGYKNLTVEFLGAATVVAAENGTGKTTLLNALNAFLSRRFHRLNSLNFHHIECKFWGDPNVIVLRRDAIGANAVNVELLQHGATKANTTPEDLLDFVIGQYSPEKYQSLKTNPTTLAHTLYINTPGDEARGLLDSLYQTYSTTLTTYAKEVASRLQDHVGAYEIMYLPTYRRVEKPLLRPSRKETGPAFFIGGDRKATNAYQGVNFGLGDIEARLGDLSEEIERQSNFGYRSSSAQILQDMSRGPAAQLPEQDDSLPSIETLTLFLGRLGRTDASPTQLLRNIKTLYETNEIQTHDYAYLRYFLYRLGQVANQTKSLEERIERFVDVCNSYLQMSSDEKKLAFDPSTLKVVVKNVWANAEVPLDDLSSGEKQIVSLMAKLYLYQGRKIILVDEPELSLSIDWQRKVLPDVMSSGGVRQMLAITHSPFIFENTLNSYTTTIHPSRFAG